MTYPSGLTLGYSYNSNGYLNQEYNAATGYNYRTIASQDDLGNITTATLGDSAADINVTNAYSNISGQMLSSQATGRVMGINKRHPLKFSQGKCSRAKPQVTT